METLAAIWNAVCHESHDYLSLLTIGFTVNTWTASLSSIRSAHVREMRCRINLAVEEMRGSTLLNTLEPAKLNAEDAARVSAEMKDVFALFADVGTLDLRLRKLERLCRVLMGLSSIVIIGLIVGGVFCLWGVLFLLTYPTFKVCSWWMCHHLYRRIVKAKRKCLEHITNIRLHQKNIDEIEKMKLRLGGGA